MNDGAFDRLANPLAHTNQRKRAQRGVCSCILLTPTPHSFFFAVVLVVVVWECTSSSSVLRRGNMRIGAFPPPGTSTQSQQAFRSMALETKSIDPYHIDCGGAAHTHTHSRSKMGEQKKFGLIERGIGSSAFSDSLGKRPAQAHTRTRRRDPLLVAGTKQTAMPPTSP